MEQFQSFKNGVQARESQLRAEYLDKGNALREEVGPIPLSTERGEKIRPDKTTQDRQTSLNPFN